tara:strand:- start:25 stop:405 length:381 start_codon:yes stop_codon:yes gene_type:complete
MKKFFTISEASEILNLLNPITKKPLNHTLRFWEKVFKQIKPKRLNNRRYYTQKQLEILKTINFLLKNEGMTISGVKKLLNSKINKLDDSKFDSLKVDYYKNILKFKSKNLLEKIKKIKNNGKKNSS